MTKPHETRLRESDIEQYLCDKCAMLGWLPLKFTSPQRRNVPDRLIVTECGIDMFFVECKAPGQTATAGQLREHERLMKRGALVYVVDSKEDVDEVLIAEKTLKTAVELLSCRHAHPLYGKRA